MRGGITLHIVRDWAAKFNAQGPDGPIDRKVPAVSVEQQAARPNRGHVAGDETFGAVVALPTLSTAYRGNYHSPALWIGRAVREVSV